MPRSPKSQGRTGIPLARHSSESDGGLPVSKSLHATGATLALLFAFLLLTPASAQTSKLSLREAIDTALEKNLSLRIVRSDERIASYQLDAAEAVFDPAFTATGGYSDRLSPIGGSELEGAIQNESTAAEVSTGIEADLPTGGSIQLTGDVLDRLETNSQFARLNPEFNSSVNLSVRQPLLRTAGFTYNLAPIRLAELQVDRANLEIFNGVLQVLRDVEQIYWLVVSTDLAVEIAENSIELGEIILEEAVEREKASLGTRVDVLESRASLSETQEALLLARKLHNDAKDLLFKSMGILMEQEPGDLQLEPLPSNSLFFPDPRTSFATALENAPTIQLQLNALRQREIERTRAKNDTLPALDLNATGGYLGRDASQRLAFDRLGEGNGYFWEVLLEFRVPFGRRAEKARYAEALTSLEREQLNTSEVKLDLYTDIRAACREVELARERLRVTAVSRDLNVEKFEQKQSERRSGQATMRDLLEAQEDMEQARLRHLEANVDLLRAIVDLAQLEGSLPHRYGLVFGDGSANPRSLQPANAK